MKRITAYVCISLLFAQVAFADADSAIKKVLSGRDKNTAAAQNTGTDTVPNKAPSQSTSGPMVIPQNNSPSQLNIKKDLPRKSSEQKDNAPAYASTYTDKDSSTAGVSLKDMKRALEMTTFISILPDVSTAVELSASDVNRVTCVNGVISDVIYSQEKGVVVRYSGKDAFIKFQVIDPGKREKLLYSTTPTEIYFVCGEQVYTIVALPRRIPAQQVKLSNAVVNRIKQNKEFFAEMPYEQRIATIIQRTYRDDFEDSWVIQGVNNSIDDFSNYQVTHFRDVIIEGEGIILKEYHVRFTDMTHPEGGRIEEKMFLTKDFTKNTIAIALDKTLVKPNERVRLFIVESRGEK